MNKYDLFNNVITSKIPFITMNIKYNLNKFTIIIPYKISSKIKRKLIEKMMKNWSKDSM